MFPRHLLEILIIHVLRYLAHTPGAPYKFGGAQSRLFMIINNDEEEVKADEAEVKNVCSELQGAFSRNLWPHVETKNILQKLKEYRDKYRATYFIKNDDNPTVEDDDIPQLADMSLEDVKSDEPIEDFTDILQVVDMSPKDVMSKIANLLALAHKDGYFSVPSRNAKECQTFSQTLQSWILRNKKEFKRIFLKADSQPYERTLALLTRIYKLLETEKHMEIREIYYTNTSLYKDVKTVADVVSDVCCMLRCTRNSLNLFSSENGLIYGDISFRLNGEVFDCSRSGRTIPPYCKSIDSIRILNSKGEKDKVEPYFILVVEKETVFKRLVEDGFCEKYHCIMITGKGMPSVEIRIMLQILSIELQLPVFALMDGNPYGLRIYSVYRYGSKKMSYDSDNLITSNIELLGMRRSDIDKFEIPEEFIEKMTEEVDETAARKLLVRDHLKAFHGDLLSMIEKKQMIQIEALYCHGLEYLAEVALPAA